MYVIRRKVHQEIIVDGPCTIKILSINIHDNNPSGDNVNIGIDAEDNVNIIRKEKYGANDEQSAE